MELKETSICVMALMILASSSSQAAMEASLLWKYDVRVPNENLYLVDLNNDGKLELIADAPKSGAVYAIDSSGNQLWRYMAGTYFYDSYATEPDYKNAAIIIGMYKNIYAIDSGGKSVWRRSLMSADGRSAYASDLNNDGYLEYVVGVFSGMKSSFQLLDLNGNIIKEVGLKGREIPYATHAADIDNDGLKEILIGGASFSINTIAENYELVPGRGNFYVYGGDGVLRWSNDQGVLAVDAIDLDNDGFMEVIVGTKTQVIAYNYLGSEVWSFSAGGEVADVLAADVNEDNINEVIAAAGKKVFLLDSQGEKKWEYKVDTIPTTIDAKDLDGDDRMEIIIGSKTVEIVTNTGEKLWESQSYNTMTKVLAGDINGDSYQEIVSGCSDGWIRVFDTSRYAKAKRAVEYKNLAESEYDQMNYDKARFHAENALMLYEDLSDTKSMNDIKEFLNKMNSRIEADGYYNTSIRFYKAGDYANASQYAQKAINIYRGISTSFGYISQLNEIVDRYTSMFDAEGYYNRSVSNYQNGLYSEASSYALNAREMYLSLNDSRMAELSEKVHNDSMAHIEADNYFAIAEILLEEGNTTYSLEYFNKAGNIYFRLGDVNGTRGVNENVESIEGSQWKQSLRTYGWGAIVLVLVVGVFLLVVVLSLVIARGKKEEIKLLLGMTGREEKPKNGTFSPKGGSRLDI